MFVANELDFCESKEQSFLGVWDAIIVEGIKANDAHETFILKLSCTNAAVMLLTNEFKVW